MSTRTPECWANDPNAEALRIEISPERSLLLPHDQFMFAELTGDGDDQNLKLVFAVHEVLIRGHHLRRIETGMQRMAAVAGHRAARQPAQFCPRRPAGDSGDHRQRCETGRRSLNTVDRDAAGREFTLRARLD